MTNVDECTKAEIGVGADIAIGNQIENGYCALFEKHINNSNNNKNTLNILLDDALNIFSKKNIAKHKTPTKKQSPTRFDKIVVIPELFDFQFK